MSHSFLTEALRDQHLRTAFDCGKPELDRWLLEAAARAETHRTCRTYVWHAGDNVVVAYFSLAAHLIERDTLSRRLGHRAPERIPAVLLARLALDKTLHGRGLGGVLLVDALSRALVAGTHIGVRFVVVDAIDQGAAAFYRAFGFTPAPTDPHRLVRKVSAIAADLGGRS
ncbi:MAG TPA: N-acetyltransferase [Mycobacteriales bacterium]|nr:N-acetyltransferase [Mycobacteriales bacterium]